MKEEERKALCISFPELLSQMQPNTTFKAAVLSSDLWDAEVADKLFESSSGKDLLFKLLLKLRKVKKEGAFLKFLDFLKQLKLTDAREFLHKELGRQSVAAERTNCSRFEMSTEEKEKANQLTTLTNHVLADEPEKGTRDVPVSAPSTLTPEQCSALREDLRKVLPPRNTKEPGFIVVSDGYESQVYDFASEKEHFRSPPGPLEVFDLTRKGYEDSFSFLAPICCAKLSKAVGGKPQLAFKKQRGHDIFCSMDGIAQYVQAALVLQPGSITKCWCWLSVHSKLGLALEELVTWKHFGAKTEYSDTLDLSMTVTEWQQITQATRRCRIHVFQLGADETCMSMDEKRELIQRDLSSANDEDEEAFYVLVTRAYYSSVTKFAAQEKDREPGPVKVPSKSAALNFHNVSFLPPECVSTLISLYGGETYLRKCVYRGPMTLVDDTNHYQYYTAHLYTQSSSSEPKKYDSYLFARTANLYDAIASAMGSFPSRAFSLHTREDVDLQMTVRDWFDSPRSTKLVVCC